MTICTGTPAELHALQYVEGVLSEIEAAQFEEHYFDCPVCLAHLQAIQAVSRELASQPVAPVPELRPKIPPAWRARVWAGGAVAALLLMSVFTYRVFQFRPVQPAVSQNQPKLPQQTQKPAAQPARTSAVPARFSQLADLTLPAYFASNLRGENINTRFEAGMKEYVSGNCRDAITALAQVSAESTQARAAEFYSGACQIRLGNYASASEILRKVADAGNSPQQEAAFYSLAQIALTDNDPATARAYLSRTISLRGDLEERARAQDRQIAELISQNQPASMKNPETN